METNFVSILRDPFDKNNLKLYNFESQEENVIFGVLVNVKSGTSYPIISGVPIMLEAAFSEDFLTKYKENIDKIKIEHPNIKFVTSNQKTWSFSLEWELYSDEKLDATWGWTVEQRYEQMLMEVGISEAEANGKIILDAGCGNGMLTSRFGEKGLTAVGLDFSDSVFMAERRRKSKNILYVKASLIYPPFQESTFDIIVSNGVLHHTPSTKLTFSKIANLAKLNGKLYVWLYSRKGSLLYKFMLRITDFIRAIFSVMPVFIQKIAVEFFTPIAYLMFHKTKSYKYMRVSVYDTITPRWRYYHTPEEVSRWYYDAGYGPITITHWDNPHGFGVVATKNPLKKTPGINW